MLFADKLSITFLWRFVSGDTHHRSSESSLVSFFYNIHNFIHALEGRKNKSCCDLWQLIKLFDKLL